MAKRNVTVHESASCRLTGRAQLWTQVLNQYMRKFPTTTLYQLARHFDLSYSNARRYYYGMHHRNGGYPVWLYGGNTCNYNQVRFGVKVDLV